MKVLPKKDFFSLFPTPEYLLLSTSGLSLTDEYIKIVQFRKDFLSPCLKLVNFAKVATPKGVIEGGIITNTEVLAETLKKLASAYSLHYVHATLPEEKAYLFSAYIDSVSHEDLRDAVAFILEENVPVSIADSVFDFEVAKVTEDGSQIKVAVSVLPKKVVEVYTSVLEAAGLHPVSFDVESQAVARAVVLRGDNLTRLIINLGLKKTSFYIVENSVVQFSTTFPYGTEGDRYRNLNDLKMEMRKIFSFWNARVDKRGFPEGNIDRTIICGEAASNADFIKELMAESPVGYDLADPWINTFCKESPNQPEALNFSGAIGLALPRES